MKEAIQAHKETKERIEKEQIKLKTLETKLQGLNTQMSKFDNAIAKVVQEKEGVLKRFALGEVSQSSVDKTKKNYEAVMLEKDDMRELITVTEKLKQQYKEEIALLEHTLTDAIINIWSEITSRLALPYTHK